MRSATLYFEKQEDAKNTSKIAIYYYDSKLRWADTRGQEVEIAEFWRIKEYEEPKVYQKRSEKSLEKRREVEQEQEGEYSKFI